MAARRLLLTLLLSQVLAFQAVLAGWSGTFPLSEGHGTFCSSAMTLMAGGDVSPRPDKSKRHHDCAAACARVTGEPGGSFVVETGISAPFRSYGRVKHSLSGASATAFQMRAAFAARAPPFVA